MTFVWQVMRNIPFPAWLAITLLFASRADGQVCLQPTASNAGQLRQLASLLSPTNSATAGFRTDVGLSATDSSSMIVVTNDSICAKVDSALMRSSEPPKFGKYLVYRLNGSHYAAMGVGGKSLFFVNDKWEIQRALGFTPYPVSTFRRTPMRGHVCVPPNANTTTQISELKGLLSGTSASLLDARSELGLTGVDTTQMTLVTTDSVCARVNNAVMKVGEPRILQQLVVYRLGRSRFGAFYPRSNYTVVFILDDAYSVLSLIGVEGSPPAKLPRRPR